ncbi:type II toxin-antitoxin system RelE/ParE family toxin [candidate division KSB1 bacterium]|nr:type II toxin-antitoxin system RelE/ParE family toxin [candidate division KSB1 bacterium]
MYEIKIHKEAEQEIIDASLYYEENTRELGYEFLDELEKAILKIKNFPLAWSIYEGEYRRYLMKRFPFGIIYRIESNFIFIIAVANLHRKPGYWKYRNN